ncbi:hypothetical protein DaAHT2_2581 [Desulfurivibrio alkaliphilus AHT 2]|uniref:Uncharacterized protein n=1 Tax=Desulfurivibrio alkaliphilus (strain DSM 19089 / UNIQEM U267 / AHT2) TaxID=589865 RepID=D6Z0Y5_DESAT|nr:hypothetical protein DaAHT2_2581 [Desulfurivibrio alkaliphilus AHT 2]
MENLKINSVSRPAPGSTNGNDKFLTFSLGRGE